MVWDGLVAVDLFLAGLGAWTYLFAVQGKATSDGAKKAKLVGVVIAFLAVALGAIILALDARGGLLNPLRFINLLGNFGSVMTWGVLLISLFLLGAFVCIVMMLVKRQPPRPLEAIVAIPAIGVSVYTGVLLSTAPAFPLWNIVALPAAFIVSAAYCGYAMFSLVERLVGASRAAPSALVQKAALVLPVLEAVSLVVLIAVVSGTQGSGAAAAQASLAVLLGGSSTLLFWGGVVLLGLVVPFVLTLRQKQMGDNAPGWVSLLAWIGILVGGFTFRFVVVVAAIPIFA